MSDDALFDAEPFQVVVAGEQPTAGARRRTRQATLVAAGYHPLAAATPGLRLLTPNPDGLRCGHCAHRRLVGGHARDFPKCDAGSSGSATANDWPRASRGEATDVKARWPACVDFQPRSIPRTTDPRK